MWTVNFADADGRLVHWRHRLRELEFDVLRRVWTKHRPDNALSRIPTDGAEITLAGDETTVVVTDTTSNTEDK